MCTLALDADGGVALSGADDGSVCGWSVDTASLRRQPHTALPARGARVLALGLSQAGLACSVAADGVLQARAESAHPVPPPNLHPNRRPHLWPQP